MSTRRRALRRAGSVAAATAALALVGSAASAHHCYKEEWQDAAYAHLSQGGTPWMPLNEFVVLVMEWEYSAKVATECAPIAGPLVEDFMDYKGLRQEPLIHMKTTVGSGAFMNGNAPGPFNYLEEDFDYLLPALDAGVSACMGWGEPDES